MIDALLSIGRWLVASSLIDEEMDLSRVSRAHPGFFFFFFN